MSCMSVSLAQLPGVPHRSHGQDTNLSVHGMAGEDDRNVNVHI